MNTNPVSLKIAAPYARAIYDFSNEQNIMHQVTADFQNLQLLLEKSSDLTDYLNNPLISKQSKKEILVQILESQVNKEAFQFLMVLVNRDRINLLQSIIDSYLKLVYQLASIKIIEISSAFPFTNKQKNTLIKKLKQITKAREIRLFIKVDPTLIGSFLIKTDSKVIDFTIKNQLQQLAKHLDSVL